MRETLVKSEEFKDSPVGRIPKDWEVKRLASITSKIIDGTHFTPTYVEDGVPFLRVTDIQSTSIDFDNVKRIPLQEHRLLTARCNPQIGDILYSKNGTVGITKLVNWHQEFSIFVSLCLIRPITTLVNPLYLAKILQSFLIEQQIRVRSKQMTVTNLHLEEIREFFIPLPKLDEQDRIVKILDTLDEAIAHTSSLIAKLKQMKAGLLHDLLTRGLDENGELRDAIAYPEQFKDSPLGQIPKDWDVQPLSELADVDRGKFTHRPRNDPRFYGGSYPFIQTGDIAKAGGGKLAAYSQTLNERGITVSREFPVGTIAITIAANIADTAILSIPMFFPDSIVGAIVKHPNSIRYVELCIRCAKHQLDARAPQSAQKNINLEDLRPLLIAVPEPKEQYRIAEVYEANDNRIRTEEAYREKLKLQKQGLMHDLLTGKVRVKI